MTDHSHSCSATETHFSWVFFTPDRAYKLLKPVTMPFIDHADPRQRLESIRREFELNKAIAPDVYLGTADVVEHEQVVDRMLVMQRLPEDRRLATLLLQPEGGTHLRAVAHAVATLHAGRAPVHDAPEAGSEALLRNWQENFEVIEPHVGSVINRHEFDEVRALVDAYLPGRAEVLDKRIADGFVRDVHGDLTADDIFCLDDGPRIIDCLAFNDRWRIVDVLSDIGFLTMDVHRLVGWRAAERLMRWYQEFSNEKHPPSLAHHYVAYRAHVRAKVACLRVAQGDLESAKLARSYHELALDHLQRARVRVILVGGGPGVGKSTVAEGIGKHFGFPVLITDEIRKDVTKTDRDVHCFAAPGEGIYDAASTAAVYDELRREAELVLRSGRGVVLDASWSKAADRQAVRELAERCGAEVVEIECQLDKSIAKERIVRRLSNQYNPSDATPELVDYMAINREEWPESTTIDTAPPAQKVIASAVQAVAP